MILRDSQHDPSDMRTIDWLEYQINASYYGIYDRRGSVMNDSDGTTANVVG